MKKIGLSGKKGFGKFVLIDDEDYDYFNQWKWQLSNRGYASRPKWLLPRKLNKQTTIYMHRHILNFPEQEVDHINQNKLDNRRINLRLVTNQQGAFNRGKHRDNISGYKGVSPTRFRAKRWRAEIKINGKNINIGYFNDPREAARAYNEMAKVHFGEYAYLNKT